MRNVSSVGWRLGETLSQTLHRTCQTNWEVPSRLCKFGNLQKANRHITLESLFTPLLAKRDSQKRSFAYESSSNGVDLSSPPAPCRWERDLIANRSSHSAFFPRPAFRSPKASEKAGHTDNCQSEGASFSYQVFGPPTQGRWSHKILFHPLSPRHSSQAHGSQNKGCLGQSVRSLGTKGDDQREVSYLQRRKTVAN